VEESRTFRSAYPPSTTKTRAGHDRNNSALTSNKSVESASSIRRFGSKIRREASVDSMAPTTSPSESSMRTSAGSTPEKRGMLWGSRIRSHRKTASKQCTSESSAPNSPVNHRITPHDADVQTQSGKNAHGHSLQAPHHAAVSASTPTLVSESTPSKFSKQSTPPPTRRTDSRARNNSLSNFLSHFRRDSSRS
jgi:hypothetical protein